MNYNFQVISPIDQSVYCERRYAFADEIEETLKKAKETQSYWGNTSLSDRISLCKKALTVEKISESFRKESLVKTLFLI